MTASLKHPWSDASFANHAGASGRPLAQQVSHQDDELLSAIVSLVDTQQMQDGVRIAEWVRQTLISMPEAPIKLSIGNLSIDRRPGLIVSASSHAVLYGEEMVEAAFALLGAARFMLDARARHKLPDVMWQDDQAVIDGKDF